MREECCCAGGACAVQRLYHEASALLIALPAGTARPWFGKWNFETAAGYRTGFVCLSPLWPASLNSALGTGACLSSSSLLRLQVAAKRSFSFQLHVFVVAGPLGVQQCNPAPVLEGRGRLVVVADQRR